MRYVIELMSILNEVIAIEDPFAFPGGTGAMVSQQAVSQDEKSDSWTLYLCVPRGDQCMHIH